MFEKGFNQHFMILGRERQKNSFGRVHEPDTFNQQFEIADGMASCKTVEAIRIAAGSGFNLPQTHLFPLRPKRGRTSISLRTRNALVRFYKVESNL